MPFGELGAGEFGTYYIGYAATPSVTEQMLVNMFIGNPPGNTDRILDFSTAVTGGLFFAPSADFLDDLPDPPGRRAAAPAPAARRHRLRPGRLPRHRQLEEEHPAMNNLHRELAPISDAAWATSKTRRAGRSSRTWPPAGWWTSPGPAGRRGRVSTGHLGDDRRRRPTG